MIWQFCWLLVLAFCSYSLPGNTGLGSCLGGIGEFMSQSSEASVWRCGGNSLLSFECPMNWAALKETEDPNVRLCQKCNENVYLFDTPESFAAHAKAKDCLALPAFLDIPNKANSTKQIVGRLAPRSYELNEATKIFWMKMDRRRSRIISSMAEFEKSISELGSLHLRAGDFTFCTDREWTTEQIQRNFNEVRGSDALKCHGVYVIYGINSEGKKPVYIGRSGTLKNDGSISEQCLHKRLGKKQDNRPRPLVFHEWIHQATEDCGPFPYGLNFRWYETYRDRCGIPPFLAEAQLLAAYLKDFGRLPIKNKEA